MKPWSCALLSVFTLFLQGCITTSMQGYADRQLPTKPIKSIVALVVAPSGLANSFQANIVDEAAKNGLGAQDAYILLPPTRTYSDVEIRQVLSGQGIDAVLILNIGDTGVRKEYAGTFFQGQYSGSSTMDGVATRTGAFSNVSLTGNSSGSLVGTSTPIHRYSRQTNFNARLLEASTGRVLWVGSGDVSAGGRFFVGDSASASSAVSEIFKDLKAKGVISSPS